jgi:hypothetical protein
MPEEAGVEKDASRPRFFMLNDTTCVASSSVTGRIATLSAWMNPWPVASSRSPKRPISERSPSYFRYSVESGSDPSKHRLSPTGQPRYSILERASGEWVQDLQCTHTDWCVGTVLRVQLPDDNLVNPPMRDNRVQMHMSVRNSTRLIFKSTLYFLGGARVSGPRLFDLRSQGFPPLRVRRGFPPFSSVTSGLGWRHSTHACLCVMAALIFGPDSVTKARTRRLCLPMLVSYHAEQLHRHREVKPGARMWLHSCTFRWYSVSRAYIWSFRLMSFELQETWAGSV